MRGPRHSAFISPDGDVLDRTGNSAQAVLTRTIELRTGRTWYSHTGDLPWIVLMALVLALSRWRPHHLYVKVAGLGRVRAVRGRGGR